MLPTSTERVSSQTAESVNRRLGRELEDRLAYFADHPDEIAARLEVLDREWDIERAIEANASTLAFAGVALGATVDKRWLMLSALVTGFLFQHAMQGWCPPVPVLRRSACPRNRARAHGAEGHTRRLRPGAPGRGQGRRGIARRPRKPQGLRQWRVMNFRPRPGSFWASGWAGSSTASCCINCCSGTTWQRAQASPLIASRTWNSTPCSDLFHASTYVFVTVGLGLLWRSAHRTHVRWSGKLLAGTLLMGFGLFNVVEGLVNHQLLGLHHVNETVPREQWIYWDIGFVVWGAAMLIGGWAMWRVGKRDTSA